MIQSGLGDCLKRVFGVVSDVFEDFYELGQESAGISMLGVGKSQNAGCLMVIKILPDVDGVVGAVDNELKSLSPSDFVLGVCLLVPQLNVLQCSDGHSHLLRVVPLLVPLASVFPLISEGVVLSSPLNLVFAPLLVLIG